MQLDKLTAQLIESNRFKKAVKAMDETPAVYKSVDDLTFQMTAPFSGDKIATFHKDEEAF